MMLNIVLLILVFGATKKKVSPYVLIGILCLIKTLFYFLATRAVLWAVLNGIGYASLAFAFIYFLRRIDSKEPAGPSYATPGARSANSGFVWEYVPLICLLAAMIFGEMAVTFLFTDTLKLG